MVCCCNTVVPVAIGNPNLFVPGFFLKHRNPENKQIVLNFRKFHFG